MDKSFVLAKVSENRFVVISFAAVVEGDRDYTSRFLRQELNVGEYEIAKALASVEEKSSIQVAS